MWDVLNALLEFCAKYHIGILLFALVLSCLAIMRLQMELLSSNRKLEFQGHQTNKLFRDVIAKHDTTNQLYRTNTKNVRSILEVSNEFQNSLESTAQSVSQVLERAENYRELLISMRDFYASLEHFKSGMEHGSLMSLQLAGTLENFIKAIETSGQAAQDFSNIMANISQDQDEIRNNLNVLLRAVLEQADSLKQIVGQVDFAIKVDIEDTFTNNIRIFSDNMNNFIKVTDSLVPLLEKVANRQPNIIDRIFG